MTGKDLQKAVIQLARTLGWKVAHTPPILARDGWRTAVAADGKGFPDLLLVRDRCIVVEIKGDGDRLRPEQRDWLTAFRMAGIAAHVWTPGSWETGEIERVLGARRQDRRFIYCDADGEPFDPQPVTEPLGVTGTTGTTPFPGHYGHVPS